MGQAIKDIMYLIMPSTLKKRAGKLRTIGTNGRLKKRGTLAASPNHSQIGKRGKERDLTDQEWTMLKHYASMEVPNLYQSYKLAGFSGVGTNGMQEAIEVFAMPAFQAGLEVELNERRQLMRVEINSVIRNLLNMANANMDDYAEWRGGAVVLKDSSELTRDQKYAIVEVKDTAQGVQIKLDSRQRALEMLATHLGFLVPDPSKAKDASETAKLIKEEADKLFCSVPTEPPPTPTPSNQGDD